MKVTNALRTLLSPLMLFLGSCASEEEVEEKHPEYTENNSFYTSAKYNYGKSNKMGLEGIIRKDNEILKHHPEAVVTNEGKTIVVTFPEAHTHSSKHHWAWIELRDYNGVTLYEDFEMPTEDIKDFTHTFEAEEALEGYLRIRVFCNVHGEYVDYMKVPDLREKTILDR